MKEFADLVEQAEAAELAAGSAAELLIAELFQDGRKEPLLTAKAMRLHREYDAARAKADALNAMLEKPSLVEAA